MKNYHLIYYYIYLYYYIASTATYFQIPIFYDCRYKIFKDLIEGKIATCQIYLIHINSSLAVSEWMIPSWPLSNIFWFGILDSDYFFFSSIWLTCQIGQTWSLIEHSPALLELVQICSFFVGWFIFLINFFSVLFLITYVLQQNWFKQIRICTKLGKTFCIICQKVLLMLTVPITK